jgi:hypothetical protein
MLRVGLDAHHQASHGAEDAPTLPTEEFEGIRVLLLRHQAAAS